MKNLTNSLRSRLRQQELRLARSILRWKLEKEGQPLPAEAELEAAAARLLDQARDIAQRRGRNLYDILREEAREFFRPKSS
jgi:hypothetical protein